MLHRIVFGDVADGRRIADHAGTTFDPVRDLVISHVRNGKLTGGVLYTRFTACSCFGHLAAFTRPWGNRDFLWVCFDYPFNQVGLQRIFGTVPEYNERALALNRHLGFREVARIPGVHRDGEAEIVLALERSDCRWLRIKPRSLFSGVN